MIERRLNPQSLPRSSQLEKLTYSLVPTTRLELVQLSPLPPQDSVSTNFTTSAQAQHFTLFTAIVQRTIAVIQDFFTGQTDLNYLFRDFSSLTRRTCWRNDW
jgi:hypothetical protein